MADVQNQPSDERGPASDREDLLTVVDSRGITFGSGVKIPRPYNDVVMWVFVYIVGIDCLGWVAMACTFFLAAPAIIGFYISQLAIIATLLTLGPGTYRERFATWYGIFFAWVSASSMLPLLVASADTFIIDFHEFIGSVMMLPAGLLAIQLPLWFMRFFKSWRLTQLCDEGEAPFSVSNFLVGAMIVAVSLLMYQSGVQLVFAGSGNEVAFSFVFFGLTIAASTLIVVPTAYMMFEPKSEQPNIVKILAINFGGWLIICMAIFLIMQPFGGFYGGVDPTEVFYILVFAIVLTAGYVGTQLVVYFLFYRADVRLITSGSRRGELVFLEAEEQVDLFDDEVLFAEKKADLATEDEIRFE